MGAIDVIRDHHPPSTGGGRKRPFPPSRKREEILHAEGTELIRAEVGEERGVHVAQSLRRVQQSFLHACVMMDRGSIGEGNDTDKDMIGHGRGMRMGHRREGKTKKRWPLPPGSQGSCPRLECMVQTHDDHLLRKLQRSSGYDSPAGEGEDRRIDGSAVRGETETCTPQP